MSRLLVCESCLSSGCRKSPCTAFRANHPGCFQNLYSYRFVLVLLFCLQGNQGNLLNLPRFCRTLQPVLALLQRRRPYETGLKRVSPLWAFPEVPTKECSPRPLPRRRTPP